MTAVAMLETLPAFICKFGMQLSGAISVTSWKMILSSDFTSGMARGAYRTSRRTAA